jgi:hypothetical protein
MVFSGSGIGPDGGIDIAQPNTVQNQIPLYMTNNNGQPVGAVIDYSGYTTRRGQTIPGKPQQARDARGQLVNASVALICYSAGTEACLMYARWRINNRQPVSSVVLLGPSFDSFREDNVTRIGFGDPSNKDGNTNFDDWGDYIDYLIQNKVDVLVVSDGALSRQAVNFTPSSARPGQQQGVFTYSEPSWGDLHYAPPGSRGTNNNSAIKQFVYNWIDEHR